VRWLPRGALLQHGVPEGALAGAPQRLRWRRGGAAQGLTEGCGCGRGELVRSRCRLWDGQEALLGLDGCRQQHVR
jgi:hypothetical protein